MTYVDAAVAPIRKTGQIKIHGSAAFESMRKAGQISDDQYRLSRKKLGI